MITYKDLIDHGLDYLGGASDPLNERLVRRACQSALQTLAAEHEWSYYVTNGFLDVTGTYSTGTISYTHSTRSVTLVSGTWPDWAPYGLIVIADIAYEVATKESSSVITLSRSSNPGANVASGTSYTLLRDTYPMRTDFMEEQCTRMNSSWGLLSFCAMDQMLHMRQTRYQAGTPTFYAFVGDPNYMGAMAIVLSPPPSEAGSLSYVYRRKPRELNLVEYKSGLATTTANLATVSGTGGTAWTSKLIGSTIRFNEAATSPNVADYPTGRIGPYPSYRDRTVIAVGSTTSLTVDAVLDESLSGVKYTISDPVDIEEGAMLTYLLRSIEKQLRIVRRMKDMDGEEMQLEKARRVAYAADSRTSAPRAAGGPVLWPRSMADMPYEAED